MYNRDNYARIRAGYDGKKQNAEALADERTRALEDRYPELAELGREIRGYSFRAMEISLAIPRGAERDAAIEANRVRNDELRRKRAELLVSLGYPEDVIDPHYECAVCKDQGHTDDGKMCVCMKRKLALAALESSGLGALADTQTFASFDLRYYADDPRSLENMRRNLTVMQEYAARFTTSSRSLLLMGPTGLGKTHLSTAAAVEIINAGYDVVYTPAHAMFTEYESVTFRGSSASQDNTARFTECELLILDDLGTEMTNAFTVATLYNVINTRCITPLPTIINTNCSRDELRKRYGDRIASRLFGDFLPLIFSGRDVRQQKLMK